MNRANLLENLIYLILTSVQVCFLSIPTFAAPNLNPPAPPPSIESAEDTKATTIKDTSSNSTAPLDSLIIAEPDSIDSRPKPSSSFIPAFKPSRVSLSTGFFSGPHQDEKSKLIYLFGMDYRHPVNHSLWNHVGFAIGGGGTNPFLFVSQETYLRNYWKYLKSWHYSVQLELDHSQGFGSLFSFNYYMGGAGASFEVFDKLDLSLSIFPLSSRGVSIELKFNYLTF